MELKCLCINNNYLNYMNGDHRSYIATFAVAKSKSEKKNRLARDSNPWPLRYWCCNIILHSAVLIYDFHIFTTSIYVNVKSVLFILLLWYSQNCEHRKCWFFNGILLCCKEKANEAWENQTANINDSYFVVCSCVLIYYVIMSISHLPICSCIKPG